MVRITGLHKRRGRLYQLELDGEPGQTVDARTFDESPYRVGSEIGDGQLEELLAASETARARDKALWLLSHRDYGGTELRRKLQKDADAQRAQAVVDRLTELGLVDDDRVAGQLARELCLRKHYPRRRAVGALCARGIDRETAQRAVEETGSDDVEQALALLRKKCYTTLDSESARQKALAALQRYGFDYETVRRAAGQIDED